jgi:hypothetical protein
MVDGVSSVTMPVRLDRHHLRVAGLRLVSLNLFHKRFSGEHLYKCHDCNHRLTKCTH